MNILKKIEKFCSGEKFVFIVAILTFLLHIVAADIAGILLYAILAGAGFVLFKDFRPSFTLMASAIFIVSMQNSPGYTTGGNYYTTPVVLALAAVSIFLVLAGLAFRTIRYRENLKSGKLYVPFALLSVSLLLAGVGQNYYKVSIAFAALLTVSGVGLYVLFSGSFDPFDGLLDYITSLFSVLALLIGLQIFAVPIYKMINGTFDAMLDNWKGNMIVGWGVNNLAGEMIIFLIPFMFRKLQKGEHVVLWSIAICFCTVTVFFTFCRAAMLFGFPMILAFGVYTFVKNPQRKTIALTIALCACAFFAFILILGFCTDFTKIFEYFKTAFKRDDKFAWSSRDVIWAKRWDYFLEYPIFGAGFAKEYFESDAIEKGKTLYMFLAHNFVMEMVGGAGILGIISTLFLLVSTGIRIIKNKFEGKLFLGATILVYTLISLFDTVYFNSYCHIYVIFALVVAEKLIEREKAKQNETEQSETARAEAEQSDISETATI